VADNPAIGQEHRRVSPGMKRGPEVAAVQVKLLSPQDQLEEFFSAENNDFH